MADRRSRTYCCDHCKPRRSRWNHRHQRHSTSPVDRPLTPLYGLYTSPLSFSWSTLRDEKLCCRISNFTLNARDGRGLLALPNADSRAETMSVIARLRCRDEHRKAGCMQRTSMQNSHVRCSSTRERHSSFPNAGSVRFGRVSKKVRDHHLSAALTRVLGSNVHEALLDATQLTPDAPSPRYHSTDKCSTGRVVKREEIDKSKLPKASAK